MTYNLVPIDQAAQLTPAIMRQRMQQGLATNQNFSEGVRDAFPVLSIKGKVWRARVSGQERAYTDANNMPIPFLDAILVNGSRTLSKTYYINGYTEGDLNPPDCWSLDAIKPDASVVNKIAPSCITCPMNAFGSRITDAGKAAKACQDARRIAVTTPHNLGTGAPMVMMLRVPQSSLKNLKAYADLLAKHGFEPNGVVTRMSFDPAAAFPRLQFHFVAPLTVEHYTEVIGLAEGDFVAGMLQAPDFDGVATPMREQSDSMTGMVMQEAPILQPAGQAQRTEEQAFFGGGMQQEPTPVQQQAMPVQQTTAPVQQASASTIIELPDGKWFDTATGQYVPEPQPVVQTDPDTVPLPDNKFFNKRLGAYVTGPEVGAPTIDLRAAPTTKAQTTQATQATQATQPATAPKAAARKRTPAKGPTTAAAAQSQPQSQPGAQAQASTQAQPQAQAAAQPNGGAQPTAAAAPQDLEDMLQRILPARQ